MLIPLTPVPVYPRPSDIVASDVGVRGVYLEYWNARPVDEVNLEAASFSHTLAIFRQKLDDLLGLGTGK